MFRSVVANFSKYSACDCLKWTEVYTEKYGVECGAAGELQFHEAADEKQCRPIYEAIPDTFCANKEFGYNTTQWCYVSSACSEATPVSGTQVAIKTCGQDHGTENTFGPYKPFGNLGKHVPVLLDMLANSTGPMENVLGTLTRFAVKEWTENTYDMLTFDPESGPTLEVLKAIKMPVLFASDEVFGAPWYLLIGNSTLEITKNENVSAQLNLGAGKAKAKALNLKLVPQGPLGYHTPQ